MVASGREAQLNDQSKKTDTLRQLGLGGKIGGPAERGIAVKGDVGQFFEALKGS